MTQELMLWFNFFFTVLYLIWGGHIRLHACMGSVYEIKKALSHCSANRDYGQGCTNDKQQHNSSHLGLPGQNVDELGFPGVK